MAFERPCFIDVCLLETEFAIVHLGNLDQVGLSVARQ